MSVRAVNMQLLFSITWGTVSGWWVPGCIALGLLYAWVLYRQPVNMANKFRYLLFAVRAVVISVVALLLLSPLVKSVSYNPQKPLVLVLQDNSQSVQMFQSPPKADAAKVSPTGGDPIAIGLEGGLMQLLTAFLP